MGFVSLPTLFQKIKVDGSEMSRAAAEATAFGNTVEESADKSQKALADLEDAQGSLGDSTTSLGSKMKESGEDVEGFGEKVSDSDKKTKKHEESNRSLGASFKDMTKNLGSSIDGFGKFGRVTFGLKLPLLVTGLNAGVGAVGALGAGAGALVAQFGPMVNVIAAAAPMALTAALSMGVLKQAFEQLKKNADVKKSFEGLKDVFEGAGSAAAKGLVGPLTNLGLLTKTLQGSLTQFGAVLGQQLGAQIKRFTQDASTMGQIKDIMRDSTALVSPFAASLGNVVKILLNITQAAGPMALVFANIFKGTTDSILKFTSDTDRMEKAFSKATAITISFGKSLRDIGIAVYNTFKIGADAIGIDFVGGLETGAAKMRAFTESAAGIQKIKDYFAESGPVVKELGLLVGDVLKELGKMGPSKGIADFIKLLRTELLPSLSKVFQSVGTDGLTAIGKLAVSFSDLISSLPFSAITETANAFAFMITKVTDLIQVVPGLSTVVATMLLFGTASKALTLVGKTSGILTLAKSLGGIGPAGAAGAKGIAGFVQGLRGASGEAASFANKTGTAMSGLVGKTGSALKTLGSGVATGVSAAFTGIGTAVGKLGTLLAPLGKALQVAGAAMKAFTLTLLTNPIFLIIAGITALIASFVLLYKNNEDFRNAVNAAWQAIKDAIGATIDWIVNTAWPAIVGAWEGIKQGAADLWNGIKDAWNGIVSTVQGAWDAIVAGVAGLWQNVQQAWNTIVAGVQAAAEAVRNVIQTQIDTWRNIFAAGWNLITAVVSSAWQILQQVFITAVAIIRAVITGWWEGLKVSFTTALSVIQTVVKAAWEVIKTVFSTAVALIKAVVTGNFGSIRDIISGAMTTIRNIFSTAWTNIRSTFTTGVSGIVGIAKTIGSKIASAVGDLSKLLYEKGRQVVQGLINGLNNMLGSLRNTASNLAGAIGRFLPGSPVKEGPLRVLNNGYAGKTIVRMIQDGLDATDLSLNSLDMLLPDLNALGTSLKSVSQNLPNYGALANAQQTTGTTNNNNSRTYVVNLNGQPAPADQQTGIVQSLRTLDLMLR